METQESSHRRRKSTGSEDLYNLLSKLKRLSLTLAPIFIVAGSGFLTLPRAIADASWFGILMLIICCINTLYASICLGKCWTILEECYDEYRGNNRHPYLAVAYAACGKRMRYFVSFFYDFTLFGIATVHLLIAAQLIASLALKCGISLCSWVPILAVILCPLIWLIPDNFWAGAILILTTTFLACILLPTALMDAGIYKINPKIAVFNEPSMMNFCLAFGRMMFAFGGASSFSTFQKNVNSRRKFQITTSTGFLALLFLYLLISVMGFLIYGNGLEDPDDIKPRLQSNIIMSIPDSPMRSAIEVVLSLHLLLVLLLVISVSAKELQEFFSLPEGFGQKRCLLRTSILLLVVFVAQSLPTFLKILDFVGGSTVTLTASVFPCYFYLRLTNMTSDDPQRRISVPEKIYLYIVMIMGIVGGSISTFFAVKAIVDPNPYNPSCCANVLDANVL